MRLLPVESTASNARMRPSGEMRGMSTDTTSAGTSTSTRIVRFGCGARFQKPKPSASAATAINAAVAHASFSLVLRRATTGLGSPACEPPSWIHWSCSLTSCAVWNRSSGSFARHARTT